MFKKTVSSLCIVSLSAMLAGCNADGTINKQMVGSIAGGAAGAVLGSQFGEGSGKVAATAAGTLIGAALGGYFGGLLDDAERKQMEQAVNQSLDSGRPVNWSSPSGAQGSVRTRPAASFVADQEVEVSEQVDVVPPLESSINLKYVATTNVNMRSGPGTHYGKLDMLQAGRPVQVKGKVQGKPWYLVEVGNVGVGYIHSQYLKPWSAATKRTAPVQAKTAPASVKTKTVSTPVSMTCTTVDANASKNGQSLSKTTEYCKAADGSWFERNA